ncbi:hypothetical protein CCYA_CCYA16G4062 [Cyanidiococcus yangmingshanensis]|nr:hypothetical protein CCYA_CCYA16G4062 [Cyanidiococcus yangmingshanensis]
MQHKYAPADLESGEYGTYSSAEKRGSSSLRSATAADDFEVGMTVAACVTRIRLDFLRKVYTILAAQLGFTAALSGAFMLSSALNQWILSAAPWLIWVCFLGTLGALAGSFWARSHPKWSFRVLVAFTLFEALSVAMVCAAYAASGLGVIVFEACFLTAMVFTALTLYCWQTQRDFSFLGGFLGAALMVVFGAALLNVLLGWTGHLSPTFSFIVSVASALLFCGYILFDTSMIIHRLGPDDWSIACISLYLDVLNLFLNLLQILTRLQASSDN